MNEFSYRVYRSLMKRKLILGVPMVPLIIIIIISAMFFIALGSLIILPFSFLIYFIMKTITNSDEYLLEIFFSSLLQPDELD